MLELIHTLMNFIWSVLNIQLDVGGFNLSYFSVIVFATISGLLFKLIFGSKGGNKE